MNKQGVNKQELKAEMARFGDRQEDLAEALGITPATLSAKVNGAVEFKPSEIEAIGLRYRLYAERIQAIFLPALSRENVGCNIESGHERMKANNG